MGWTHKRLSAAVSHRWYISVWVLHLLRHERHYRRAMIALGHHRLSFTVFTSLAFAGIAARAGAQTCEPSTTSHEAKIFGNRSLALAFGRGAPVTDDKPGTVFAGVEFVALPPLSSTIATPTTCRPGKGPENVNSLPGIARLTATMQLPGHFSLGMNWLPPVPLQDMTGNVFGAALGYSHLLGGGLLVEGRAHGTVGYVTGPITCPEKELTNVNSECFGGTKSSDRFEPNIIGADFTISGAPTGKKYAWYGGVGYEQLSPRFQVHFLNQAGVLDTTRARVDLQRVTIFGGGSWTFGGRWRGSAELFATPDDGVTIRLVWAARLGKRS